MEMQRIFQLFLKGTKFFDVPDRPASAFQVLELQVRATILALVETECAVKNHPLHSFSLAITGTFILFYFSLRSWGLASGSLARQGLSHVSHRPSPHSDSFINVMFPF
jgi:hypothetical protein